MARGDLRDNQPGREKGIFEPHPAKTITAQLALAVAYIHRHGVVHGGTLRTRISDIFLKSNYRSTTAQRASLVLSKDKRFKQRAA